MKLEILLCVLRRRFGVDRPTTQMPSHFQESNSNFTLQPSDYDRTIMSWAYFSFVNSLGSTSSFDALVYGVSERFYHAWKGISKRQ
jgi:hypothetical protein